MQANIFRSYDIRGLAPQEINEQVARRLGKVLSALYHPKRVVVGRDMRETSLTLEDALVEGLIASGVSVTRIGLCSTPMFNFAVGEANGEYDLGIMVTASHNPAAYNGFKLMRSDCSRIGQGSGMEEIQTLMLSGEPLLDRPVQGKINEESALLGRYLDKVMHLAELPSRLPKWKFVVDTGNGMAGMVFPELKKRLSDLEILPLYWELDGTFPNHEPNPIKGETLHKLRDTVMKIGAIMGVAFDGDADRIGLVDEQGEAIPGDLLTALISRELIQTHGPITILYDLRSSWVVPEVIHELGGKAVMSRVGGPYIKKQMAEEQALFAGEVAMHFYFADAWNCEMSELVMLLVLRAMIREQKPLSALWHGLKKYAHSGEMNFTVQSQANVMKLLEDVYLSQATDITHLDGLRMEFRSSEQPENDWWFNVRASNTEPLLRLNLEARTLEKMEMHKKELVKLITA